MIDLYAVRLKNFGIVEEAELLSYSMVMEYFPVSSEAPYRPPMVLRLRGEGFDKTTDVIINGQHVQFSKVYEPGSASMSVFAIIPDGLSTQKFSSIYVLIDSRDFTTASLYEWEFGSTPKFMSGIGKCVAQFVKVLLTTPGTDSFDPTLGAGLPKFVGQNVTSPSGLMAAVTMRVVTAVNDIRARNSSLTHIPNDEKLASVDIISLNMDPSDPGSVMLVMRVNTFGTASLPVQLMLGAQDIAKDLGLIDNVITPSSSSSY